MVCPVGIVDGAILFFFPRNLLPWDLFSISVSLLSRTTFDLPGLVGSFKAVFFPPGSRRVSFPSFVPRSVAPSVEPSFFVAGSVFFSFFELTFAIRVIYSFFFFFIFNLEPTSLPPPFF